MKRWQLLTDGYFNGDFQKSGSIIELADDVKPPHRAVRATDGTGGIIDEPMAVEVKAPVTAKPAPAPVPARKPEPPKPSGMASREPFDKSRG